MGVRDYFMQAVEQKFKSGELSRAEHMPLVEAAAKVASVMDEPEWPIVRGKIDNVSPAVFLKYCDALGIVPNIDSKGNAKPKPKLASVRSANGRFAKVKDA